MTESGRIMSLKMMKRKTGSWWRGLRSRLTRSEEWERKIILAIAFE